MVARCSLFVVGVWLLVYVFGVLGLLVVVCCLLFVAC